MKTILSIQSSVTMGAVGNTMAAAVFAGTRHHLCRVDTIQLAAHPGHGFRAGGSIADEDFAALLEGLDRLGNGGAWQGVDAMMTGYTASAGQIPAIAGAMDKLAASGSGKTILVDPVFGDHGRLYVGEDIAKGIRDTLIPRAGIITPNAFELGWLAGMDIANTDDAAKGAANLLEKHPGIEAVVTTGIVDDGSINDTLHSRQGKAVFKHPQFRDGNFHGAGDLFAAIVMKELMDGLPLQEAVVEAGSRTADVLERTQAGGEDEISLTAVGQPGA